MVTPQFIIQLFPRHLYQQIRRPCRTDSSFVFRSIIIPFLVILFSHTQVLVLSYKMSLENGSGLVRLRDKIDTALQVVQPEQSPKVAFIATWRDVQADYELMRQVIHQYLSRLLDEKQVRATVASRTKTLDSISKSIDRRDDARPKEQKFRSPHDILDDLHDLVGLRVVVDYPSGLDQSFRLIEESF